MQTLNLNDSYNYEISVADIAQNIIQGAIVTFDDELNDTLFNKLFKNSKNYAADFSIEPNPINSIQWNCGALPAGIYFVVMESGERILVKYFGISD